MDEMVKEEEQFAAYVVSCRSLFDGLAGRIEESKGGGEGGDRYRFCLMQFIAAM